MFNQFIFGERLKSWRRAKNFTQDQVAAKIGVSGQAVSKWEKGECLPDVYNLKLLGRLYRVSLDDLLDTGEEGTEKVVETVKIGGAAFEIVEKPAAIFAGKIVYAKDFGGNMHQALSSVDETQKRLACEKAAGCVLPICDITLSVNFWLEESRRAMGFVRETATADQPEGVDVYKMPASLYIRAYTDRDTAYLLAKKECDIWELFAYIRNWFMPAHGFRMAGNGAQEMEVFDTAEHKTGYAYMPVMRI
ncbi:MAG: helix-turn-helix domain-containing protein [Oscillospiraceae bacterium]|nr:helix-turn-helix domain-containing protein [Oscillospiraceae bacterium]